MSVRACSLKTVVGGSKILYVSFKLSVIEGERLLQAGSRFTGTKLMSVFFSPSLHQLSLTSHLHTLNRNRLVDLRTDFLP